MPDVTTLVSAQPVFFSRVHKMLLTLDASLKVLHCDLYAFSHHGEPVLTDSARIEGKPLRDLVQTLQAAARTYPGTVGTAPLPEPEPDVRALAEEDHDD
jgi:hypothetical protein